MRTKIHSYTTITIIVFASLFFACMPVHKVSRTEKIYYETTKQNENTTVSYKLPVIKSTGKTTQSQTKGGVIISAEIVSFTTVRNVNETKTITYADASKPGYDIYEVLKTPYYTVSPENIQFKVRIRNNEQVPLKLSEVGFAIIIDGTQWSFPSGYLDDWNKGIILTGFEKDYTIRGPQLDGLYNAQVVYLFLNGVPTSYDEAGSVTKKSNFEWYFECKTETVLKDEQKTYSYEASPIYKEQCHKCSGTGTDPQAYKCSSCNGSGLHYNPYDKKNYTCSKCNGKGIVYYKCPNCNGLGVISMPISKEAPVKSSITWTGWRVNVTTNPPGAKVSVVDTKSKEYKDIGMSNCYVDWFSSNSTSYPIIIEYQGQSVKVLPYNPSGKEIPKVVIDFLGGSPNVTLGRKVN